MANINTLWSTGDNWRWSSANNTVWTAEDATPTPTTSVTLPSTCCPGPPPNALAWTPCLATAPMTALVGYTGMTTRTRGDRCPVSRITWTTDKWTYDTFPSVGDLATINGSSYFVDSAIYHDPCVVVLQLCRPIIECPDCLVEIRRLRRIPGDCPDPLFSEIVAIDVPATVCISDQIRRVVDNAEIQLITARICLDTTAGVQVGDLVFCNSEVWRIDRIESPCSSQCLLTIAAIKEPWKIDQTLTNYLGSAVLLLPTVDAEVVGLVPEYFLGTADLLLPVPQLESTGEASELYFGFAEMTLSAIDMDVTADQFDIYLAQADLDLPALLLPATGIWSEADTYVAPDVTLDIPALQAEATGTFTEVYTATAELTLVGIDMDVTATQFDVYLATAALDLPAVDADALGTAGGADEFFAVLDGTVSGFQASGEGTLIEIYTGTFYGQGCGYWTTDLDEIVTTETLDGIEFGPSPCPIVLSAVDMTSTGTYSEPVLWVGGGQMQASPIVEGDGVYVNPMQVSGGGQLEMSQLRINATAAYTGQDTGGGEIQLQTPLLDGTGVFSDPPGTDSGSGQIPLTMQVEGSGSYSSTTTNSPILFGGFQNDPAVAWSLTYPDENMDGSVTSSASGGGGTNCLVLAERVLIDQGQIVDTAQIFIRGIGQGSNPPPPEQMILKVTGWAIDQPLPRGSMPGWDYADVQALPRTVASTTFGISFNDIFSVTRLDTHIDVTAIVNEIVARPGWVNGNDILFFVEKDWARTTNADMGMTFNNDNAGGGSTQVAGSTHFASGEKTAVTEVPGWMQDGTDEYLALITADGRQKLGVSYDSLTHDTVFDIGTNFIQVDSNASLETALALAKTNTSIRAIYLDPGIVYHWPMIDATTSYLSGMSRNPATTHPLVIMTTPESAYQAKLEGPTAGEPIVEQKVLRGLAFVDLEMTTGLRLLGNLGISDILVERCRVWLDLQGGKNVGQTIPGTTLVLPTLPLENILIRQNSICEHYYTDTTAAHGLYAEHVRTMLVEGNIIDHNGWGPAMTRSTSRLVGGPDIFKHNVLINPYYVAPNSTGNTRGVEIRYNMISRGSSHGAHLKTGGNVYRNLFISNPIACQQGFGDDQFLAAYGLRQDTVFRDNVTIGAADINSASGDLAGIGWITTCTDNAQFIRNCVLDDRTSATDSEIYRLECNYPIDSLNMEDNAAADWPLGTPIRETPCVPGSPDIETDTNNDWTQTITPFGPLWDLSEFYQLSGGFQIDWIRVARWRFGVNIGKMQREMQTVRGSMLGISE